MFDGRLLSWFYWWKTLDRTTWNPPFRPLLKYFKHIFQRTVWKRLGKGVTQSWRAGIGGWTHQRYKIHTNITTKCHCSQGDHKWWALWMLSGNITRDRRLAVGGRYCTHTEFWWYIVRSPRVISFGEAMPETQDTVTVEVDVIYSVVLVKTGEQPFLQNIATGSANSSVKLTRSFIIIYSFISRQFV